MTIQTDIWILCKSAIAIKQRNDGDHLHNFKIVITMGSQCSTPKCENDYICEKSSYEEISTLNVKIYAICENITLNVKKIRLAKSIKKYFLHSYFFKYVVNVYI